MEVDEHGNFIVLGNYIESDVQILPDLARGSLVLVPRQDSWHRAVDRPRVPGIALRWFCLAGTVEVVTSSDVWDAATAKRYDDPSSPMFRSEVLTPTVDFLASLAGEGPVLEFAIGTGRVAVPLAARGIPVSGIELFEAMVGQLRTKVSPEQIPVVIGDMATWRPR